MNIKVFNTLVKNGKVYDPSNSINKRLDIGILDPNIGELIDPETETQRICYKNEIDADGCLVVPGLIEMHSHVLEEMDFSMDVESMLKFGVVATCDMGSVGYNNFSYFRRAVIEKAIMPVNAAINLSTIAFITDDESEYACPGFVNKEQLIRMINIHKDVVIGVKVQFSIGKAKDCEVLEIASQVCRETGTRMVVHVTDSPVPLPEWIKYFEEGDIVTHTYHGHGHNLLDENGRVYQEAWDAKDRGVIFDACRGTGHWCFPVLEKAFDQGFMPDLITADTTSLSAIPLTCQLPTVMSELLALGMPLDDIIKKTTVIPANMMKNVKSGIKQGNPANLTVLDIVEGEYEFKDSHGNTMKGSKLIVPKKTIVKGKVLYSDVE